MSGVITPPALAALIAGKRSTERIHVRIKDDTGYQYFGHVADLMNDSRRPEESHCTIVTNDGDVVWRVLVTRIEWIDVRPRPASD